MICPKCGSKMYLDNDLQSLKCEHIMCSYRDYQSVAMQVKQHFKPDQAHGHGIHSIICAKCGKPANVQKKDELYCYNCRVAKDRKKKYNVKGNKANVQQAQG